MTSHTRVRAGTQPRTIASVVAMLLAFAGLVALPMSSANAAGPDGLTFKWNVSAQFVDHFTPKSYAPNSKIVATNGASFDSESGMSTFTGGTGKHDSGGVTTMQYQGTITGTFEAAGQKQYSITVSNPRIEIANGEGTLKATVSSELFAGTPDYIAPATVVVTTFSANSSAWTTAGSVRSLTATPKWAGAYPEGPETLAAGVEAGFPLSGKAFSPEFITQIITGAKSHFYVNGTDEQSAANLRKPAGTFTAQAPAPSLTASLKSISYKDGVTFNLSGTGFTAKTNNVGDGIYIGLAPSGDRPDVSDMANMALFAGVTYVDALAINSTTGAFTSEITAATANLNPSKSYSIYTWRAHAYTTDSQDTETPVNIDFSKLAKPQPPAAKAKVTTKFNVKKKPTTKKKGKAIVKVKSKTSAKATGKVRVFLKKGKATKKVTAKINKKGKAKVKLPKLKKGKWQVRVKYLGSPTHQATKKVKKGKIKVKK